MTKLILSISLIISIVASLSSQIVNIPDANFKAKLIADLVINTNEDDEIQLTEAVAFTGILECSSSEINSLEGLEAFTEITKLRCINNNLTVLDVSKNTKLERLDCYSNDIVSLDISMLTELDHINAHTNLLTELDIAANTKLRTLFLQNNPLDGMYLPYSEKLQQVIIYNCGLTTVDVSMLPNLTILSVSSNNVENIDVSGNPKLISLRLQNCGINEIDISSNVLLTYLQCDNNNLTELDLSNNKILDKLDCANNQLDTLVLDSLLKLKLIYAEANNFRSFDFSHLPELWDINVRDNQLTFLNIANGLGEGLEILNAGNNPDLLCVQVDDENYAMSAVSWIKDDSAVYSEDCSTFTTIEEQISQSNMILYPNPVTNHMQVACVGFQIHSVQVFSMSGEQIPTTFAIDGSIDVSNLDSGMYLVEASLFNGGSVVKRFVKL